MRDINKKLLNLLPEDDVHLPPIGIEDIDRALFSLFDTKLNFEVRHEEKIEKVPVVFAAGERFALTRRKNPIRDDSGAIILPIISILRQEINFSSNQPKGTPISFRAQPDYVVKRKLSHEDRYFQNLLNKQGLKNQKNVSSKKNFQDYKKETGGERAKEESVASRRQVKQEEAPVIKNINKNTAIYEIIQIPYPTFVTTTYEVTFWCQYMTQVNQMIEILTNNFSGQGQEFAIKTREGYDLVAFVDANFASGENTESYSDEERIIKRSFTVTIPGYILASKNPGEPLSIRKYISSPRVVFESYIVDDKLYQNVPKSPSEINQDKFSLSNVLSTDEILDRPRRGDTDLYAVNEEHNPFSGEKDKRKLELTFRNVRKGESVYKLKIDIDN